ncbi:uncharacterized protein PAE49_015671 [Odontesthes bonariensis]|uniref:uncharacterized protein LOC142399416 n=1 Tax=Odontesthes bonariensis TaxID=219752 RepID=UPI003F587C56
MNRPNRIPFTPPEIVKTSVSGYKQLLPVRVPQEFMEAMQRISGTSDMAAKTQPKKAQSPPGRWRSSFTPINKQGGSFQDKGSSSERTELYDPSSPLSSDSESEMSQAKGRNLLSPSHDKNLSHRRSSPDRVRHDNRCWESSNSEPRGQSLDNRCEFTSRTRPTENKGISPGHILPERGTYSPDAESPDRPGFAFTSGPLDQRGCCPESPPHGPATQRFPVSYGGQITNGEERITLPEYRREVTTTHRLSPPRLKRDYPHQLGYVETGLDQEPPSRKMTKREGRTVRMDSCPITCDLCDVELANAQELEAHLDSKSHWDTLEHIQLNKNYDDLAIAFLQEVMLYKSHHCSRAIEDSALQALQENAHMTKVEMFHCAACKVYIYTSAAEVQTHITSQEHLSKTKEFEVQQRRACLDKADIMIKELKPQFEHFLKGGCLFE